MKILLICAGGITSKMLARKMEKYIAEHEFTHEIKAISVQSYNAFDYDYDVVLLAPQTKYYLEVILPIANQYGSCLLQLDELDFVDPNLHQIFKRINACCKESAN